MKISRWTLLWILIVGVLVAVEVAVASGRLTGGYVLGSVLTLLFFLVVISVLSIVGAVFVGLFVSHRILSTQAFTPFEQEMLRMRQDLREISERVDGIATRLGVTIGDKKREP